MARYIKTDVRGLGDHSGDRRSDEEGDPHFDDELPSRFFIPRAAVRRVEQGADKSKPEGVITAMRKLLRSFGS